MVKHFLQVNHTDGLGFYNIASFTFAIIAWVGIVQVINSFLVGRMIKID